MKNLSRRRKNNIIIACLCGVLALMGVGYAVFNTQLKINGTSSISSEWNIQITNIETALPSEVEGENPIYDGYNISEPTYTAESATFNAGFETPGSVIYYVVEISNLGSIDGQVTVGNLSCGDNSNSKSSRAGYSPSGGNGTIWCDVYAYDKNPMQEDSDNGFQIQSGEHDYSNEGFPLKSGEKHYIMVTVGYEDVEEQPTDLDAEIKLDLTYEQYVDPNAPVPSGETTLVGNQEVDIVSGGDGLYEDSTRPGRYVYKGANPNNYIEFNGEMWRIVAKETDGTYKIVRNELLSEYMPFDERGHRDSGSNGAGGTYCANSPVGCNAWASTANMVGTPEHFTNTTQTGTVLLDSTLNTYLNTEFYNSLSKEAQSQIVSHEWGIGAIYTDASRNDDGDVDPSELVTEESAYKWIGKVALLSSSDVYLSVSNEELCGTDNKYYDNVETCAANNYLVIYDEYWWLLSPNADNSDYVWFAADDGGLNRGTSARSEDGVRPAAYLISSLTLSGQGTLEDPFVPEA